MTGSHGRRRWPVDATFQSTIHGLEEIMTMRLNVKADEVRAEKAFQHFRLPRTNSERFRIGPRNVPEDCNARVGALLLNEARQQREMVILDENHGFNEAVNLLQYGIGELLIGTLILIPVAHAECRTSVGDVAERPESFVGKSVVVAFLFLLRKPDATQRVTRLRGGNAQAVIL